MSDYLKIDPKRSTRPQMSVYELAGIITQLAQNIYDSKSLKSYISEDSKINGIINPCDLALQLLEHGEYDVLINRDSEKINFSDLYIDPRKLELLDNYFSKQRTIINREVNDKYKK